MVFPVRSDHTDTSSTPNEDIKDSDSLSDFGDAMSTPSVDFDQLSPSVSHKAICRFDFSLLYVVFVPITRL